MGHSGGRGSRSPSSILLMTSSFFIPTNGFIPRIRISQQHTPVRRRTEGGEEEKREGRGRRGRRKRRGRRDVHSGTQNMCQVVPNIHTSLSPVNLLKLILSGAIHFMGNFPLEAVGGRGNG